MISISARIRTAYWVLRSRFGLRILPLFGFAYHTAVRLAVTVGAAADTLFFSARLQRTALAAPIVLIGPPRTGTTFLHRFLDEHNYGAGTQVWRALFPSVTIQAFIKPVLPLLKRVDPTQFHSTDAHRTSMVAVETDDVSTMFRYFDGFLLYAFVFAFHETDLFEEFDPKNRDTSERDFMWIREVWRRNLAATGASRQIGKLFSAGARVPAFTSAFPDARMIYTARDPLQAIPSAMSLVSGVLDRALGFSSFDAELKALWYQRTYRGLVALLNGFTTDWESGAIDQKQVLVVRYDDLLSDFESVMHRIHEFSGHLPTAAQTAAISSQAERQKNRVSNHQYDLAQFGLSEEQVRRDCDAFYRVFLPPRHTETPH